jgi:hypothetical protein
MHWEYGDTFKMQEFDESGELKALDLPYPRISAFTSVGQPRSGARAASVSDHRPLGSFEVSGMTGHGPGLCIGDKLILCFDCDCIRIEAFIFYGSFLLSLFFIFSRCLSRPAQAQRPARFAMDAPGPVCRAGGCLSCK